MSKITEDIHEQLLKEFRLYFEEHQIWEAKETHLSGVRLRHHLSNMGKLCTKMRIEIQKIREAKPKVKSPYYRQSLLQDQQDKKDT